jgi:hypothetical protein
VCEPVHISLAFRCMQLLLKNVGYTGRLLLRSSPDSAATSAAPERHNGAVDPTTSRLVSAGWLSPASHSTMRGRNLSAISASSAVDLVFNAVCRPCLQQHLLVADGVKRGPSSVAVALDR